MKYVLDLGNRNLTNFDGEMQLKALGKDYLYHDLEVHIFMFLSKYKLFPAF